MLFLLSDDFSTFKILVMHARSVLVREVTWINITITQPKGIATSQLCRVLSPESCGVLTCTCTAIHRHCCCCCSHPVHRSTCSNDIIQQSTHQTVLQITPSGPLPHPSIVPTNITSLAVPIAEPHSHDWLNDDDRAQ